jgi:phosphatidylglycerophosphate synthase
MIIVCIDLLLIVGAIALLLIIGRVNCQPTILGKASTFLQIIAVISVIVGNHVPVPALTTIWWATVAFTCVSGFFYVYRGVKQL